MDNCKLNYINRISSIQITLDNLNGNMIKINRIVEYIIKSRFYFSICNLERVLRE